MYGGFICSLKTIAMRYKDFITYMEGTTQGVLLFQQYINAHKAWKDTQIEPVAEIALTEEENRENEKATALLQTYGDKIKQAGEGMGLDDDGYLNVISYLEEKNAGENIS